mmetsp:Transcript_4829/g.6895  ORF Transcript_4829/g.6895 Transcript_4829/m.6895 type:complete len:212 (-) Transcript_4829:1017-1652(-)
MHAKCNALFPALSTIAKKGRAPKVVSNCRSLSNLFCLAATMNKLLRCLSTPAGSNLRSRSRVSKVPSGKPTSPHLRISKTLLSTALSIDVSCANKSASPCPESPSSAAARAPWLSLLTPLVCECPVASSTAATAALPSLVGCLDSVGASSNSSSLRSVTLSFSVPSPRATSLRPMRKAEIIAWRYCRVACSCFDTSLDVDVDSSMTLATFC